MLRSFVSGVVIILLSVLYQNSRSAAQRWDVSGQGQVFRICSAPNGTVICRGHRAVADPRGNAPND